MNKTLYSVQCHCGRLRGRFLASTDGPIEAWDCSCSDCRMRGNNPCLVPVSDFALDMQEPWEDASTLYQWGTKTAVRRFCKTCGILPWYTPRSDPNSVGITIHCVGWINTGKQKPPEITLRKFDGAHYEESIVILREEQINTNRDQG